LSYREVCVEQVREVLRAWLDGAGLRTVAARAGVDRKTARRYVEAAEQLGVARDGGVGQLDDGVIGQVVGLVRPVRPDGHGAAWEMLLAHQVQIGEWVDRDLTVVKIGDLLGRQGVLVPYRTLHRFCVECCGFTGRKQTTTVRVADGEPGVECQLDFGELGLLPDPATGRRRKVHALVFTAARKDHRGESRSKPARRRAETADDDRPSVLGVPFDGPMPAHEPGQPIHYDLHMWLWVNNPAGLFAPWNPKVTC
jgi:hypothetical protein